jgi:hypothetical protein
MVHIRLHLVDIDSDAFVSLCNQGIYTSVEEISVRRQVPIVVAARSKA